MNKQDKIKKVMREFKNGKLKTPNGEVVTDKKQALAIAMSESDDYAEKADLIEDISISSLSHAEDVIKSIGSEELFEKAVYADTAENRKLGRVGQDDLSDITGKKSPGLKSDTEVRKAVDEMGISDAYRELFDDDLEKAVHQDGDIHPKHPDWVWVSSAAKGKGDWRKLNGRIHKKHSDTQASNKKQENNNKTNHPQGGTKSNQSAWGKLSENVSVELGKQIVRQNLQRETAVKNWVSSVLKTAADEGVNEVKKSTKDEKKQSSTTPVATTDKSTPKK